MSTIQVFTDTGSDMTNELIAQGIKIVPLYITFDGKESLKQMIDLDLEEFYDRMRKPHDFVPKSSLASIQDYYDIFEKELQEGNDVLYICMSGKFSSTLGAANNARDMLLEEYPDRKVVVVDCNTISYGQHYITKVAKEMIDNNKTLDEVVEVIEDIKPSVHYFFTVESLNYLKDGGRIGGGAALLGEVLNIKPVLKIEDCHIDAVGKVRGRNKSLDAILDELVKFMEGKNIDDYEFVLLEGDVPEEASEYKKEVLERLNLKDIVTCKLGISIGLHAGPGTMGLGVMKKYKG